MSAAIHVVSHSNSASPGTPTASPAMPNMCRYHLEGDHYILDECNCLDGYHQPPTPVPGGSKPLPVIEVPCT